ncbi:MAG: serine hydrolase [Acidimicrobiales bacterium]
MTRSVSNRTLTVGVVALIGVVVIVMVLTVPFGSSAQQERVITDGDGAPAAAGIAQVTDMPWGRIDSITSKADRLVVAGWSTERDGLAIEVDGARTSVGEVQRRFDVEAATGSPAWGFSFELATPSGSTLCLTAVGRDLDCRPWRCDPDLFPTAFVKRLRQAHPEQRFTAHVKDTRTGCEYELKPDLVITTASVIKVEILAGVLLRAQAEDRGLSSTERALVNDMMRLSLNPPTSTLWARVGGIAGLNALDRRFGVTNTVHTPAYGATTSTARDRNDITLAVLHGGGPLNEASAKLAWRIMAGVHPGQQWGVSAGVAQDYTVVNKNGFYPLTGAGWRVGSTGFVADPAGGGYALTIMSDNNHTQADGIELVEAIARRVNRRLSEGPAASRPFDDTTCLTHTGGQTWRELARELGLPASAAEDVRLAAGGDGPMRGQLVCAP